MNFMKPHQTKFIDDGDQVTVKILWSQEANIECENVLKSKSFFITPSGANARTIKFECIQTMFDLTKDPTEKSRKIIGPERDNLVKKNPQEINYSYLIGLFADKKINGKIVPSRYNVNDIIELAPSEWHNPGKVTTTIGRLMWNKVMIDRVGLRKYFPYNNNVQTKKNFSKHEEAVTLLLREDQIDTDLFRTHIEHRDWLGLQLHSAITASFTPATIRTPETVKALREELFKKYEKEIAEGDTVVANKIEKELIDATVELIKNDPGFDLYASGARGDINNHLKNIFLMRGAVMNPNTGKYDIMKTSFNEGLRKEDFTAASNSVVQGAYPKAVGTADSGYLAKQLMAGMQTEVIDEAGSDCGTTRTLNMVLSADDLKDFQQRYIDDNGHKILLTSQNSSKYAGKLVKLYSPMCCIGKKICEKCAGKQDSKFIGLDSNKIATTLTNLNMKKFHDSTIRLHKLDADGFLSDAKGIVHNDGTNMILDKDYLELYIPMDYFKSGLAEDLGDRVNLFGLTPVGLFDKDVFTSFDTLNVPSWNKYNVFSSEVRDIVLPGVGNTECKVLKYYKGHEICLGTIIEDSQNAQLMLNQITYGKVPSTIPYTLALIAWRKNQKMNNVNFGVPSVHQEVVLSCIYRYKKDPSMKFATIFGKNMSISEFDYELAGIRRICQVTSTFTGITFESFDDMVTTSANRSRTNGQETESPLEVLFRL